MNKQQPEALRLAEMLTADEWPGHVTLVSYARECVAELRRLHAYCQELESQVIRDCMTHAQKPAEIEHVAGDVSKNGVELNMSTQQPAPAGATFQQPTQAVQPAGWEPEFDQFLSDVMTAAGLVTHGKQCKQLGERLGAAVMKLRRVAASVGRKV